MHSDSLSADLKNHLYWCAENAPPGKLRWVMDIAWFSELRHLDNGYGYTLWAPELMGDIRTLLGVPVDIRDSDDRPGWVWRVPHLEIVTAQ